MTTKLKKTNSPASAGTATTSTPTAPIQDRAESPATPEVEVAPDFLLTTEAQAEQATATGIKENNGGSRVVVNDLYTSAPPLGKILLQDGRNIVRPIGLPRTNTWFAKLLFYVFDVPDSFAAVCPLPGHDVIRAAQIALYDNVQTALRMRSANNKDGFRYLDKRRALFLVSKYSKEQGFSPFGYLSVPVSKEARKSKDGKVFTPKPQWGDRLIELPAVKDDMDETKYKWGVVYCPEKGRMITLDVSNAGKPEIDVKVDPHAQPFALGSFEGNRFVADPRYTPLFRPLAGLSPDLREIVNYATPEVQLEMIRRFTPEDLLPVALKAAEDAAVAKARK